MKSSLSEKIILILPKLVLLTLFGIPVLVILILLFGSPIFEFIDNKFYDRTPYLDEVQGISIPREKVQVIQHHSTYLWNGEGSSKITVKLTLTQTDSLQRQLPQHSNWQLCNGWYIGKSNREQSEYMRQQLKNNNYDFNLNPKDCYCFQKSIGSSNSLMKITFCPNNNQLEISKIYN